MQKIVQNWFLYRALMRISQHPKIMKRKDVMHPKRSEALKEELLADIHARNQGFGDEDEFNGYIMLVLAYFWLETGM